MQWLARATCSTLGIAIETYRIRCTPVHRSCACWRARWRLSPSWGHSGYGGAPQIAQLGSRGGRTWSMAAAQSMSKSKSSLEIFPGKPFKYSSRCRHRITRSRKQHKFATDCSQALSQNEQLQRSASRNDSVGRITKAGFKRRKVGKVGEVDRNSTAKKESKASPPTCMLQLTCHSKGLHRQKDVAQLRYQLAGPPYLLTATTRSGYQGISQPARAAAHGHHQAGQPQAEGLL